MWSYSDLMSEKNRPEEDFKIVPALGKEVFIFLCLFLLFFGLIARKMGLVNMISTLMNTAFDLTVNVCFYIMAISVLTGALGGLLSEFGVIALLDRILSYLMNPLYGLPGAASIGIITCYLSDNPAIVALVKDPNVTDYFEDYQLPGMMNLGTAFGMGLIITSTIMALPLENAVYAAIIGNFGAVFGSIISVKIVTYYSKKHFGIEESKIVDKKPQAKRVRTIREGNVFKRMMESLFAGGRNGVQLGFSIIPTVVIICSVMFLLTNGPSAQGYTGGAGEGVAFLPRIAEKIFKPLHFIFGFSAPESVGVPIMALGSAGAAIGLIPDMVARNIITANDLAVFTAFSMCWSGYLATEAAMLEAVGMKELTGKAIFAHTIGGICAGIFANIIFKIIF